MKRHSGHIESLALVEMKEKSLINSNIILPMKKIMVSFLCLVLSTIVVNSQVKNDTIKNETVIKLTKAKLGDKIILQKISTSPCAFDISTEGLINLKENSVSDTVINLMVYKQSLTETITDVNNSFNSDGGNYTFKESGIYFKKDDKYISLDPTVVTSSRGTGVYSTKFKSQIEGKEANYQFTEQPEFFFNFTPLKKDLNNSNANVTNQDNYMQQLMNQNLVANNNAKAVSPNEFKLIKLDVNKNKREYVSGKISAIGQTDFSIDDKCLVTFKYEKVSEYTYKITFPKHLVPGEYCFLYLSNNAGNPYLAIYGQNNTKVFDFGVK